MCIRDSYLAAFEQFFGEIEIVGVAFWGFLQLRFHTKVRSVNFVTKRISLNFGVSKMASSAPDDSKDFFQGGESDVESDVSLSDEEVSCEEAGFDSEQGK